MTDIPIAEQIAYWQSDLREPSEDWPQEKRRYDEMLRATIAALQSVDRLKAEVADLNDALSSKRGLTREIDVILNGEVGATKQASLCDLLGQIERLKAEHERAMKVLRHLDDILDFSDRDRLSIMLFDDTVEIEAAFKEAHSVLTAAYDAALSPEVGMIWPELICRLEARDPESAQALIDIGIERLRQLEDEGWSPLHDDRHATGELARAAAGYAQAPHVHRGQSAPMPSCWPWDAEWWKPKSRHRNNLRAGGLIVAELARHYRILRTESDPSPEGQR